METMNSRISVCRPTSVDVDRRTLNCIFLICAKTGWPDFDTYINTDTSRQRLDHHGLLSLLSDVFTSSFPNVGELVESSCCGASISLGVPITNRK